nr:methyltransferase [Rhodococcus sp. JVH1]
MATTGERTDGPDSTAVRVALWRAMHVQVDAPPHVLVDEIGPQLAVRGRPARPPNLEAEPADRAGLRCSRLAAAGAGRLRGERVLVGAAGCGGLRFSPPQEMLSLAREAGFADTQHVAGTSLAERYFADRSDGPRPSSGEDLLVATT